jgi:hypothetical protein
VSSSIGISNGATGLSMRASSCHAIKPDESIEVAQDVCDHVTERSKPDAPGSLNSRAEVVGEVARVARGAQDRAVCPLLEHITHRPCSA